MHFIRVFKKSLNVISLGLLLLFGTTFAALPSPAGFWQTTDEASQQPNSIIQITRLNDGSFIGNIVKLYKDPNAVCANCSGELHNKPLMGMTVLWGFSPENGNTGKVLAVKRGSVFDASLGLQNQGQELVIGVKTPFGSKNQVWQRVAKP